MSFCIERFVCIGACTGKVLLGPASSKAKVINASNCLGHKACFHSYCIEAITFKIGMESQGIDLPHIKENFEKNVRGI